MDSDFEQQQYQHHFQEIPRQFHPQKQQTGTGGLTRFRSAPSSYFASFLDVAADSVPSTGGASGGGGERRDFSNARPLSPETENIFARFMSNIGAEINSSSQKPSNLPPAQSEYPVRVKQETDIQQQQIQEQQLQRQLQQQQQQMQQGNNYSDQSQVIYHSPAKPPLSNQHNSAVSSAMQNSLRAAAPSSRGIASIPHMKTGIGGGNINNNSSLTRHSSSPAGFFANLNIDTTAYGMIGGMGNYGGGNGSNVQVNISSGRPGLVNQNSDVGAKRLKMDSLEETSFTNPNINHNDDNNYEFPMNSWDDSILSENFDEDRKIFPELNASENQTGDGKNCPPPLTHHLSLPKTLPELSNMERFLQYQDSVPLRIRAKRGCATHPRSIAERVRRTKISERMRKLQDLVPNMDKQTNTADMLDLAVDYIKELQKEVETLNDNRAKCTCSR